MRWISSLNFVIQLDAQPTVYRSNSLLCSCREFVQNLSQMLHNFKPTNAKRTNTAFCFLF